MQYQKYDNEEAAEIVIPKEISVSAEKKAEQPQNDSPEPSFFGRFLDFAESLGETYIKLFKGIILFILPVFLFFFKRVKHSHNKSIWF